MTPEEQAVINAAIRWAHTHDRDDIEDAAEAIQDSVDRLLNARDAAPAWHPATLINALAGDRIRIGQDEAQVIRSNAGVWHADTSNAWHPKPWVHTELRLELDIMPGFNEFPPNTPCEIWCTPERLAVLNMQQGFPGSRVVP